MNKTWQYILAGAAIFALIVGAGFLASGLSWNSHAQRLENLIVGQNDVCEQMVDAEFNIIVGTLNLSNEFYDQMEGVFTSIFTAANAGEAESNTASFLALLQTNATLSGTDWASVKVEAMRVVSASFQRITGCLNTQADNKQLYSTHLGRTVGAAPGQGGVWPNTMYAGWFNRPALLVAGAEGAPARDLDGDFRITVLDYPSVVVTGLTDGFDDGELPQLFPTPTAAP